MPTFETRIGKDGRKSYRAKVRRKGAPSEHATFARLTDARRWARQTEAAIEEGRYFPRSESAHRTLANLIDRYIRDVLPTKPLSARSQHQQLLWWRDRLGTSRLRDVTPARLAECRDELLRGVTPGGRLRSANTVARYMAVLRHALNVAMKEWGWIEDNPFDRVANPKLPRGRARFLSDDERARLLAACRDIDQADLYLAVVLALSTGARKMEVMSLTWDQVDLGRGRITLEDTKNGERRALPLKGHALDLMKTRAKVRRIDTDLVFPGRTPSVPLGLRSRWRRALRRAEITDFRWHDLRHSAASYLAMNGATLAEIAEVLGHKTLAMVKRYAHLSEGHTAKVVESMNEKIFGEL